MLVARMHRRHVVLLSHHGAPVHVGIAEQREMRVDAFRDEGFGQNVMKLPVRHQVTVFP